MPSTSSDSLCFGGWGGGRGPLVPQRMFVLKSTVFITVKKKLFFQFKTEAFYSICRFYYTWNGGEIEILLHSSLSNAPSYLISLRISQSILL